MEATQEDNTKTTKDHIEESDDEEQDDHVFNEKLQCRFYRKDFPEENDLVMVIFSSTYSLILIFYYDYQSHITIFQDY